MPEQQPDLGLKGDLDYVAPDERQQRAEAEQQRRDEEAYERHLAQHEKDVTARMDAVPSSPPPDPPRTNLDKAIDETMRVEFKDFGEGETCIITDAHVRSVISAPTKRGIPASKSDIHFFLKMCQARRLNPWVKDVFLVGYDTKDGPKFSTIVAHQALLKRGEHNAQFDGKQSGVAILLKGASEITYLEGDLMPPGATLVGGWCRVHRRDRQYPEFQTTKLSAYQGYGEQWSKNTEWMITKCAESKAMRSAFPSDLSGMYAKEELFAIMRGDGAIDFETEPQKGRVRRIAPVQSRPPAPAPEPAAVGDVIAEAGAEAEADA